jgi:hypothetical protein
MGDTKDMLIIGAIAVGAYVLFKGWKGITDFFGGAADAVGDAVGGVTDAIGGAVETAGDIIDMPDTGNVVDLWKAGTGQQAAIYNYEDETIGYVDPEETFPGEKAYAETERTYGSEDALVQSINASKKRKRAQQKLKQDTAVAQTINKLKLITKTQGFSTDLLDKIGENLE